MPEAWARGRLDSRPMSTVPMTAEMAVAMYTAFVGDLAFQLGKHTGVDHEDISHGHKGGEAGDKLGADCGAVLLQFKELFHCITLRFRGLR